MRHSNSCRYFTIHILSFESYKQAEKGRQKRSNTLHDTLKVEARSRSRSRSRIWGRNQGTLTHGGSYREPEPDVLPEMPRRVQHGTKFKTIDYFKTS